jgi:hypothetical protein
MNSAIAGAALIIVGSAPLTGQQVVTVDAKDRPLTGTPATVYTVGTEDGNNGVIFAQIGDLTFDARDNLYVLDRRDKRILIFDATGRLIREHAKRGAGPGEMQSPFRLAVTTGGHLIVSDQQIGAFLVFAPTGEPIRNIAFAELEGRPSGYLFGDDRGGVLFQSSVMPARGSALKRAEIIARLPGDVATSRAAPESSVRKTSFHSVVAKLPMPDLIPFGENGRVSGMRDPIFGPDVVFGTLPAGGVAMSYHTEYRINILDSSGTPVRTLTRAIAPKKTTSRDKEEWNQRRLDLVKSLGPRPPGMPNLKVSDFPFAEQIAVIRTIRTDPSARIWVQRRKPNGEDEGPIDILTANGRYIGTLPPQPLPRAVSASGLAAYVVADELGVERVVVKRIPASWR